jgi:hypothetical protein
MKKYGHSLTKRLGDVPLGFGAAGLELHYVQMKRF